jgi:ABC-type molybdate transport system substrate-binding protein
MKVASKLTLLSALIGGMFSAQTSFAADTVCSLVYRPSPTQVIATEITANNWDNLWENILEEELPDMTIAVASNFYAPAIDLIDTFMTNAAGAGYFAIGVCHNATGHLVQEITGSNPAVITGEWLSDAIGYKYGMFLAADDSTPAGLAATYVVPSVIRYANGIPALLANPNRDPSALTLPAQLATPITPPSSMPIGYLSGTTSYGPVIMNTTNLAHVAIGSVQDAPYGKAACRVIKAMNQWSTPNPKTGNVPTDVCNESTGTPTLCMYDNISVTLDESVLSGSGLDAGWMSWAQILSYNFLTTPLFYTFPDYAIGQSGVRLTNPNPAGAGDAADTLWGFMDLTRPGTTGEFFKATGESWNQWLASSGYGVIPGSNVTPPLDADCGDTVPPEEN